MGDGSYLLELFHGPTLAFKDVALQLVGRLFDHELHARGERVTIVGATSGDTGSAAIEACRDRDSIDIVILHPAGRVSEVQRRQMTTVLSPNVYNVAIEGTFDDCQDLVKAMFVDHEFRAELRLSAVNSINWARVMAQIVYYVVAAERLGRRKGGRARVHCADRQLRQRVRRLRGASDGRADLAVRRGIESQRHPHLVLHRRHDDHRRGPPDVVAEHGHPGVVQPRTPALRVARAQRRGGRRAMIQRFRTDGTVSLEPRHGNACAGTGSALVSTTTRRSRPSAGCTTSTA